MFRFALTLLTLLILVPSDSARGRRFNRRCRNVQKCCAPCETREIRTCLQQDLDVFEGGDDLYLADIYPTGCTGSFYPDYYYGTHTSPLPQSCLYNDCETAKYGMLVPGHEDSGSPRPHAKFEDKEDVCTWMKKDLKACRYIKIVDQSGITPKTYYAVVYKVPSEGRIHHFGVEVDFQGPIEAEVKVTQPPNTGRVALFFKDAATGERYALWKRQ